MYRTVILPAASKDILKASQWYENQNEDLGERFKRKTIDYIDKLQSDFIQYAEVYRGLRRVFMKGFPYQIYFKKDKEREIIIIHAVLHNKQSRTILNKRI